MNNLASKETQNNQSLIPVFTGNINNESAVLVDARALHKTLQVGRRFATWIVERIKEYGFLENQDYIIFHKNQQVNIASQNGEAKRGGHNRKDYHLTLDMAKELGMIERTEIGRSVRRYFINCEKELHNRNKVTEYTTADERTGLRQAVDAMVGKLGMIYPDAYKMVHQRFNVTSIDELTAEQVEQATEYVHRLTLGQQESEISESNLKVIISHFDWCHSWFTYHEKAIRAFNPRTASAISEHFDTAWVYLRDFGKNSGMKLLNRERMQNYPWHANYHKQKRFKEFESAYLD